MKSKEILERIENLINNRVNKSEGSKTESEDNPDNNTIKKIGYLTVQLVLNILRTPFKVIAKYLRDEIVTAIKKDIKIYALIIGIMVVLFVFFSVLWLFISIAVGVSFFEQGHSLLLSIIYSIAFQIISLIAVSLIAVVASRKLKSLKMLKKVNNYTDQKN